MSLQKKVIVFLTDGAEEMEFTIAVDVLRRAQVDVTVIGVDLENEFALCSRGVKILPEVLLGEVSIDTDYYDALIVPGGSGVPKTLNDNEEAKKLIMDFYNKKKIVAFICASPLVAKAAGIPHKHKITSYPAGIKKELVDVYNYSEDRVVVDENVITSRGPGTSFLFALTIVEQLVGVKTANALREEMLTASEL